MIKVEKNLADIPSILTQSTREIAFNHNILVGKYDDPNHRYKVNSIQKKLKKIYHLKCAFCEKKLLDAPKHIEHYRPKAIYYWLAYSWDNLLLACGSCNSAKGDRFATTNTQVTYNNEPFTDIHTLGSDYDTLELPMIINPEKEDVLKLLKYDKNAKISSDNPRVNHTIEIACKLNRDELLQLRETIITDFINRINQHYFYFLKDNQMSHFIPDITNFIDNCKAKNSFYSLRYFVCHNAEIFFEGELPLQKIVKGLFAKLRPSPHS